MNDKEKKPVSMYNSNLIMNQWKSKRKGITVETTIGKFNGVLMDIDRYEITIVPNQEGKSYRPMVIFKANIIAMYRSKLKVKNE